jgi:hypothetical protein
MEMQKETPCVVILNKQKCHLFLFFLYKIGEQDLPGVEGLVPMEGRVGGEIGKEGEYGANTVYTCM